TRRGDPLAVGVEGCRRVMGEVPLEWLLLLARGSIPQPDVAVPVAHGQGPAVRAECHGITACQRRACIEIKGDRNETLLARVQISKLDCHRMVFLWTIQ